MQTIKITLADNGVIKTVIDDNINAAGESFEATNVHEFNTVEDKIKFIEELCMDIGLSFGNSKSKEQIKVITDWGQHYKPTPKEALEKIRNLQVQLENLKTAI
jgi:hypothetical protein